MEDNHIQTLLNIIKLPFVFTFYLFYMFFTLFIPSKYVSRVINIEAIEENMNTYINNPLFLKFIALIITIFIFIYFD